MKTIKARLIAALASLSVMVVALAVTGWVALDSSNARITTIYSDRVVPLRDLKIVSDMYAVNIVDTAHKVRAGALGWEQGSAAVQKAEAEIARRWNSYAATYMDEREKTLARDFARHKEKASAAASKLKQILDRKDRGELDRFVVGELYPSIDPATDAMSSLVEIQLEIARQEYDENAATFDISRLILGVEVLVGLLAVLFSVATVVWRVVGPLNVITALMGRVANGDLDVAVTGVEKQDEIGLLARSLQVFKENALANRLMQEKERAAIEARAERQHQIEEITRAFDAGVSELLGKVSRSVEHLHTTSDNLSATAEETQRQSSTVSHAAEQATANVETVAGAGNELSASIQEIARQVEEQSVIAAEAERGASGANGKIQGLADAVAKIGEVTTLINDIATKTNLLALNATIEAARAGETGRGFAVVASEVKALASQTAKATEEITLQIGAIQSETASTVSAIHSICGIIMRMRELATAIAGAVEQQGAATGEIVRNVDEAAQRTRVVALNIDDVAKAASVTGEMATSVFKAAAELQQDSEHLHKRIEGFLRQVHAA